MSDLSSRDGLHGIPLSRVELSRKDFASAQQPRWCPGCGDYSIVSALQTALADLGVARENTAIISGIGCSSRLPYYMSTYGMHSIHGRAPAIATGLAMTREDLAVIVVTGDGDGLSIGTNHLIHALRRNINMTILLLNNSIYGLTKGQFSPTSRLGQVTKSSPHGTLDSPLDPISLAISAQGTFIARCLDSDRASLVSTLCAALSHRGTSLIEIVQNCPVFNDYTETLQGQSVFSLVDGKEIVSEDLRYRLIRRDGQIVLCSGEEARQIPTLVHDMTRRDNSQAYALAQFFAHHPEVTGYGIFRKIDEQTYDDRARQLKTVEVGQRREQLHQILAGADSWTIDSAMDDSSIC